MTLSPRLVVLMTLPTLLWASNAVVGRLAVGHVAPQTLNAWRWAVALLLLLPLGWRVLADVRLVAGDLLMLLAVSLWAYYSWLLARPPASMRPPLRPDWDWAQFLFVQVLFGIGWSWLAAGVEQALAPQPVAWSPWIVALIPYVAIGPSIVAFRCWGIGVAQTGPTMAAFFSNLSPLFAALLSVLLVSEAPHLYHAVAFALVLAGIVVSSRR